MFITQLLCFLVSTLRLDIRTQGPTENDQDDGVRSAFSEVNFCL